MLLVELSINENIVKIRIEIREVRQEDQSNFYKSRYKAHVVCGDGRDYIKKGVITHIRSLEESALISNILQDLRVRI